MFTICGKTFYTDVVAGEMLGCTARTVRTLIKQGKLKGFATVGNRNWRVWETDLLAYMKYKADNI